MNHSRQLCISFCCSACAYCRGCISEYSSSVAVSAPLMLPRCCRARSRDQSDRHAHKHVHSTDVTIQVAFTVRPHRAKLRASQPASKPKDNVPGLLRTACSLHPTFLQLCAPRLRWLATASFSEITRCSGPSPKRSEVACSRLSRRSSTRLMLEGRGKSESDC